MHLASEHIPELSSAHAIGQASSSTLYLVLSVLIAGHAMAVRLVISPMRLEKA